MCVHEKQKKSYQQSRKRWAINLMTPVNNLLSASFSVTLAIISLFVCLFIFLFTWHQSTTFEFVYMCVYSVSFYNLLFIESRNFEMKPQLLLLLTLNSPHSFFLHLEQRKKNVLFNFGVKIAIAKVIDHQKNVTCVANRLSTLIEVRPLFIQVFRFSSSHFVFFSVVDSQISHTNSYILNYNNDDDPNYDTDVDQNDNNRTKSKTQKQIVFFVCFSTNIDA